MAHTKVTKDGTQNTGTANTFSYSGSFNVFKASEVEVELDNVKLTFTTSTINDSASPREYTVDYSAKTIHIGGANLAGTNTVVIQPVTDMGAPTPRATYEPGSSVTSADLNNNQLQLMRKALEYDEQKLSSRGGTMTGNLHLGKDIDITFEGDTANDYETTLTVADPTSDKTITLPDTTGTVVTTGDTATVTATMLAADSVDSSELVDGSIDTSHIADSQVTAAKLGSSAVTTVKIATDAVTNAKIADDSIDSEHYVDGSIDTAHIADSQITSAKIADGTIVAGDLATNAVTTAKITDDNVTTAKIAADAITGAKIADDAVDSEHIAADSLDTEHYAPTSIDAAALASNAVTTSKITDANVTTVKVADSNITLAKLASDLKQTSISDSDTQLPTSGAVVDYVAAQIAPLGGLEVIADEDNFPTSQPASGVVISISDAAGIVVNGSGVSTTARTAGNGSDNVTINNFPSSLYGETLASGVGLMVSSTGSSNTYNYHKILAAETDVKQLSDDINDFNARYRVNAGEPGSNNDDGDLVFDTNANKMKVYDATAGAWTEVTSTGDFKFLVPVDAGTTTAATFDGSDTSFDLKETTNSGSAASVTNVNQLIVNLNGVVQKPNTGSYSASEEGFYLTDADTIRFCTAPATGSTCFIIQCGSAVSIPTPGDGTVTTAKIASGAVTTVKIADDAVTAAKLASNAVVNASVDASAAIAGTKISPDFGSQDIVTTGGLTVDTSTLKVDATNNRVGIGDATPSYALEVATASGDANIRLKALGTGTSDDAVFRMQVAGTVQDNYIYFGDSGDANAGQIRYNHNSDFLAINTNAAERCRIDSDGRFILGHTSDIGLGFRSQLVGTDGNTSSHVQMRFTDSASGPQLTLGKSRNATPGSNTIVQDDDVLGSIQFRGDDGTDYLSQAASIQCKVDGTPGSDDMPGCLLFNTTKEGDTTPTKRMIIQANGEVALNSNTTPGDALANLHVQNGSFRVSNRNDGADTTYLKIHAHNNSTDHDRWSIGYVSNSVEQWAIRKDGHAYFRGSFNAGRTRNDVDGPTNSYDNSGHGFHAFSGCTDDTSQYRTRLIMRVWDASDQGDRNAIYYVDSMSDTTAVDYDQDQKFGIKGNGQAQFGNSTFVGRVESDEGTPNSVYPGGSGTGLVIYPGTSSQYNSHYARTTDNDDHVYRVDTGGGVVIRFNSDGNGYFDGGADVGAAGDYAEYFEWKDGNTSNADRRGITVVMDGEMIRPATDSDDKSKIIGVVSANPAVVGDSAWSEWQQAHLKDAYGSWVTKDEEFLVWNKFGTFTDKDGNKKPNPQPDIKDPFMNAEHQVLVADIDAEKAKGNIPQAAIDQNLRITKPSRTYNPDYDPTKDYVPRSARKEWDAIGLVGKLVVRRGQPVGTNWILMKSNVGVDPTDNSIVLDKYLVR